ncbi:DUF721 domain-containing protein [Candidatus Peregrinibacteria bacterium]|nr:DUF721 domain-containing protein [Candidatus Peregrinibacteria bacterium]
MFTPLKDLLPRVVNSHGMHRTIKAATVCEACRKVLPKFFDEEICAVISPKFFRHKTLTLSVQDSALASEIFLSGESLILAVNSHLGRPAVREIRTIIEERCPASDEIA